MEQHYKFEAEKFGLSEDSIHLLRNRFNYKTINLKEIRSIEIERAKDLSNWLWVLFIGILLVGFTFYDVSRIIFLFNDDNTRIIYIERLLIPLFPFLLGVYTIFISLRNSMVMKVYHDRKRYYFSLRKILKEDRYNEFLDEIKKYYSSIIIRN